MPILESALGIENAFAIAQASENVVALTIGLEDYTADLGRGENSRGQRVTIRALTRGECCPRRRSSGDRFGIRRRRRHGRPACWGRAVARHGIRRNGLYSSRPDSRDPRSVSALGSGNPKAQSIVAAFEEAQSKGLGVVSLGSKMIDPPVVNRALKLVERAKAMGAIS
jgi:citrate lyase subunit beta / citryl-CoA lyase